MRTSETGADPDFAIKWAFGWPGFLAELLEARSARVTRGNDSGDARATIFSDKGSEMRNLIGRARGA
jgi:hypothetical protein